MAPPDSPPALKIEGVRKSFQGQTVLDAVDLEVAPGSLIAVLGSSGSGKTTLLRLVAGFERLDAGRIAIAGETVAGPGQHVVPERRGIGYVMQEGALFPHLSVAENIMFGAPRAGRRDAARVAELLDLVGLHGAYAARAPHLLSGGEQQRVALARALAASPRLVLLDEPFSALDAALRSETRRAVAAALRAVGASAILVTHDQSEALSLGSLVAVLRRGRLVQVATPSELYRRPADAELARFVGEAVLLPGMAGGGRVRCGLGTLTLAEGVAAGGAAEGAAEVMVRPEQIRLVAAGAQASVSALVREVVFYGHDAVVGLSLADARGTAISARLFSQDLPAAGSTVGVAVEGPVIAYPAARDPSQPSVPPVIRRIPLNAAAAG